MSQLTNNFINEVIKVYATDHGREHSYRPSLKDFFATLTGLTVVNEPKRSEYGAPDFVFLNKTIVTAYAEAKDLNVSLAETVKGEQMGRYYGYSNIILTNCLEFRFYRNGQEYVPAITIAKLNTGNIEVNEDKFQLLEDTIQDFIQDSKEPIKSGKHLAKVMAGKARRIRDNIKIFLALETDIKNENLFSVFEVIKKLLLADLDKDKFADMYAQTVVYGLFAARYYDSTQDTFSRQEARDLLPVSNPFLRHFFDHIGGSSFDPRIEVIVNELCEEFNHADVQAIVHNYYKVGKDDSRDPIIHFYEDFLQEYDSVERKKMGVFYTPLPVVRFIVRAIDDILKRDFGLVKGLTDTTKIEVKRESQGKKYKDQIHRVQILDPATGTGTFLNETILHIMRSFVGQEGRWNNYVNEDLLPRLHGFELMMASYTIAHLKLSSTIIESGAKLEGKARLGVYLTNSLEKGDAEEKNLFSALGLSKAISEESQQAGQIKHNLPIMVVLGNPPYSGVSSNNFESANKLIDKYKFEPGGKIKLKERNPKWLNDDYVKFIAMSEDMINKTGEGVLGLITNHSYLDNPTFRGMRWQLAQTFDEIYIVDLHGNSKKKEKHPDGTKDENVFDIQQGVAIIIGIKRKSKGVKKDAKVFVADIFGKREVKFDALNQNIEYKKINLESKQCYFVDKNIDGKDIYESGFSINELFKLSNVGIVTCADSVLVARSKSELIEQLNKAKTDSSVKKTIQKLKQEVIDENKIQRINYRPFDGQYIYYEPKVIERARLDLMWHFIDKKNIGICLCRQQKVGSNFAHIFVSNKIIESSLVSNKTSEITSLLPLYFYNNDGTKTPNLKKEIVAEIEKVVGVTMPEDILDYIYAILHSPSYRAKYKEFLKIDFPRVPYPTNKESFLALVDLGRELRGLHLLESPKVNDFITTFSEAGSNEVEKKFLKFKDGKVYINETQYFGRVPEVSWQFYIGGYQPAQKWLKDRYRGRKLSNTDIEHYQKIIVSLSETDRIMREIDGVKY